MSLPTQAMTYQQNTVARPSTGVILQRKCACGQHSDRSECTNCTNKHEQTLQRTAVNAAHTPAVPPIVHDVLSSPGQSLDADTRAFMEPRFGHDFSGVRVHTDARAAESARAVNALAYTVGRDVVFGTGQYVPESMAGKQLLAHELTHVVQQSGTSFSTDTAIKLGVPGDTYEREADVYASRLAHRGSHSAQMPAHHTGTGPVMQRTVDAGVTQKPNPPAPGVTPGTSGATPTAPTSSSWTTDLLTITLHGDRRNCFGMAVPSGSTLYSSCGSPVRAPFCQSALVPFTVDFYVDRVDKPRPSSLNMPKVSVDFAFVTPSGKGTKHIHKDDPSPHYDGVNIPLKTSFGHDFPIGTDLSGTLHVQLTMDDTAAGAKVSYTDQISYVVRPCV